VTVPGGTDVCALADVAIDSAIVVALGAAYGRSEIIVVRDAAGVRGYNNVCPHLPLPLNIDRRIYAHAGEVYCDHHYAAFRFSDGLCTAGACVGEALTAIPLRVVGERVTVA
jgi:nitrite reductase/ring-hydroxylating ferredoxin subunit